MAADPLRPVAHGYLPGAVARGPASMHINSAAGSAVETAVETAVESAVETDGAGLAIVLFAHGARDARWALSLEALRDEIARRRPGATLRIAFLELQKPDLPETLAALSVEGFRRIDIAPVFWSKGNHVARDLPALVSAFAQAHPQARLRILPVLAELPGMQAFVAEAILAQAGADADAESDGGAEAGARR